jgi:hypothetical protein
MVGEGFNKNKMLDEKVVVLSISWAEPDWERQRHVQLAIFVSLSCERTTYGLVTSFLPSNSGFTTSNWILYRTLVDIDLLLLLLLILENRAGTHYCDSTQTE